MTGVRGVPPGRSGRLWLARRLAAARRGADVLDRKMRILRHEQDRFEAQAQRAASRWTGVLASAETWALRAGLLAGHGAVHPAWDGALAEVRVEWSAVMGARFPSAGECLLPPAEPRTRLAGSAAQTCATAAYREALTAAVEAAVALGAARVIAEELATTRTRARALEDRWIPHLEEALVTRDLALAESDSAEAARLRLAVDAADAVARPSSVRGGARGGGGR